MNVKYMNPFIAASKRVLSQLMGTEPIVEAPRRLENTIPGSDYVVIVGLTGEVKGQVMFTLEKETAIKIVRKMTYNDSINELDFIGQSAISEMGNMISGSTGMEMYAAGITIDITPPSLCSGEGLVISSKNKFVSIPLHIEDVGKIYINISFEEIQEESK